MALTGRFKISSGVKQGYIMSGFLLRWIEWRGTNGGDKKWSVYLKTLASQMTMRCWYPSMSTSNTTQQGWPRLEPGAIRQKMSQSLSTWLPKSRRMGGGTEDIKRRLRKAKGACHRNLTKLWNTRGIGKKRKIQLYKTIVRPIYSPIGVKHGDDPLRKQIRCIPV